MASYYYLIASLPMLRFDDGSPMTEECFLRLCHQQVKAGDMALIRAVSLDGRGKPSSDSMGFIRSWQGFLTAVRNEMNSQRAKRLARDSQKYKNLKAKDRLISETVREALNAGTPLQGELILLRLYWKYIEQLAGPDIFSLKYLLAYHVELQILARRNLFTQMEGNAEFKRLFTNLQTTIKSI
ncbi:MAG: DUF2764 domain-containing protein [Sphaerochaetaceae bacterium]